MGVVEREDDEPDAEARVGLLASLFCRKECKFHVLVDEDRRL
jgi:hypothetical protein